MFFMPPSAKLIFLQAFLTISKPCTAPRPEGLAARVITSEALGAWSADLTANRDETSLLQVGAEVKVHQSAKQTSDSQEEIDDLDNLRFFELEKEAQDVKALPSDAHKASLQVGGTRVALLAPSRTEVIHREATDAKWMQLGAVLFLVLVFTTTVAIHVRRAMQDSLGFPYVQWHHLTRGCSNVGPLQMSLWRLGFAAFVFIIWANEVSVNGAKSMAEFTWWNWFLIGVYGLVAGTSSAMDAAGIEVPSAFSKGVACSCWVLFQVLLSLAFIIFVLVWCVLIPQSYIKYGGPRWFFSWTDLCVHNLNVGFMLMEGLFNRFCFGPGHAVFCIYFGASYLVFSWAWYLHTGEFHYFFINWNHPVVFAGYAGCVAVCVSAFFGAGYLLDWAKRSVAHELPMNEQIDDSAKAMDKPSGQDDKEEISSQAA
jgi:hypothetical protein